MNKPQQSVVDTVLDAMKKAETDGIRRKKHEKGLALTQTHSMEVVIDE